MLGSGFSGENGEVANRMRFHLSDLAGFIDGETGDAGVGGMAA